jgi:hypothetical protein
MMEQTAALGNEASAASSSLDEHPQHRLADREEPAQLRVRMYGPFGLTGSGHQ